MKNYKRFSVFMVSFLISVTILSVPAALSVFVLSRPDSAVLEEDFSGYVPIEREDITILFGSKSANAQISTAILAKFSPLNQSITLCVIPAEIMVEHGGRFESLAGVWKKQGGEKAALALSTVLEVPISRYATVDLAGFIQIVDTVGRVELLVKNQVLAEGGAVAIEKGTWPIDGRKMATMLSYTGYPDGEQQRLALVGQTAATAINQRLPTLTTASAEVLFTVAVNLADTNISYTDYHFRKKSIGYMTNFTAPASYIPITGSYNDAKNTFILSPDSLVALRTVF